MLPDILRQRPYIDQWRTKGYQYYVIPKSMLTAGKQFDLGIDEAMLYAVLRDRTKLSFKNNWVDPDGRIYLIYTRDAASKYIGWSLRKTQMVFQRLVAAGLLEEQELRSRSKMLLNKKLYLRQWGEPSPVHPVKELLHGGFPFFTKDNVFVHGDYYVIPFAFFEDEALKGFSLRAIFLYMLILDELHLSITYGRTDADGKVWCSLDSREVADILGCSARSLVDAYGDLEEGGLLVRRRSRSGPMRLYLRDYMPPPTVWEDPPEEPALGQKNLHTQNLPYGNAKSTPPFGDSCVSAAQHLPGPHATDGANEAQDLPVNHPPFSQPSETSIFGASIAPGGAEPPAKKENGYETIYGQVQAQIEYMGLIEDIIRTVPQELQETWFSLLDQSVGAMATLLSAPGIYVRVGDKVLSKEAARMAMGRIDRYILFTLLEKIVPRLDEIRDIKRYLQISLLTAADAHEGAAYYTRQRLTGGQDDHGGSTT